MILGWLLSPVVMTTSQFARIPLYNPPTHLPTYPTHCSEGVGRGSEQMWDPPGASFPHNGALPQSGGYDDREFVIANGHSMSPTSSTTVSKE